MKQICKNEYTLDFLGGILYGSVTEYLIQNKIEESALRMSKKIKSEEPLKIAEIARSGTRDVKIVAFFALLNYDISLKNEIIDIGKDRAANFYMGLRNRAMRKWIEDQRNTLLDLKQDLKTEYRNA